MTPRAISTPTPTRSRRSAARRQCRAAGAARHLGQALGAASALRSGVARACSRNWCRGRWSCAQGQDHDLNFTIDAEEADRLELSLEVIERVLADPSLQGWDGLAVQAYQKRAAAVIDWLSDLALALDRQLMVRLVKGAYWDTEVKRAQERGLADYPVFTRKPMTDLSYVACMRKLLAARPRLYPQFATHNALTVATVVEEAGGIEGYEFQRLHGMGEVLYEELLAEAPGAACRVYAPVGSHRDLLAYLVRRLLENGANRRCRRRSRSFGAGRGDPQAPAELDRRCAARHPQIPLPRDLYRPARVNSSGIEFGDRVALEVLLDDVRRDTPAGAQATPLIDGAAEPVRCDRSFLRSTARQSLAT